jgi:HSP20 family molecular chaperone IbpA
VPLPEGAVIDKINATFNDGVLELVVPVPKLEKVGAKKGGDQVSRRCRCAG